MHSKIFQISISPITNLLTPSALYDNSEFADYIGDVMEGKERLGCIENLVATLSENFDYDRQSDTLIFKGMGSFLNEWANAIKEKTETITADNILSWDSISKIGRMASDTHKFLSERFYIEDYNGFAEPAYDLFAFLSNFEEGTRLYIGSVIDYHY